MARTAAHGLWTLEIAELEELVSDRRVLTCEHCGTSNRTASLATAIKWRNEHPCLETNYRDDIERAVRHRADVFARQATAAAANDLRGLRALRHEHLLVERRIKDLWARQRAYELVLRLKERTSPARPSERGERLLPRTRATTTRPSLRAGRVVVSRTTSLAARPRRTSGPMKPGARDFISNRGS